MKCIIQISGLHARLLVSRTGRTAPAHLTRVNKTQRSRAKQNRAYISWGIRYLSISVEHDWRRDHDKKYRSDVWQTGFINHYQISKYIHPHVYHWVMLGASLSKDISMATWIRWEGWLLCVLLSPHGLVLMFCSAYSVGRWLPLALFCGKMLIYCQLHISESILV